MWTFFWIPVLRETKAICCQIVAFHPDPASSWKIRCSFKFRIQKVTSVRWFLTSTCVFSDFGDANDWLTLRGSFKPALNLIRSISMIFFIRYHSKWAKTIFFKWSLRFPPNLVCLHLRYVPPQPGQLRPLETIDHHGHGLASGPRGVWLKHVKITAAYTNHKYGHRLKPFFGGSTGGTVSNIIQCICTYSSYFTLAWNNIFIHLGSPKIPMMHLHLQTDQRKNSHLSFSVQKHICPRNQSLKATNRWVSRYLLMASSLRLMPKHHVGVTKKIWSCL